MFQKQRCALFQLPLLQHPAASPVCRKRGGDMGTSLLHFTALTSHTLNLTELYHPYSKPVTHPLRLRMKPLNPPCRCLPLSCPSDGQDYWVVPLAAGLWQSHVGSFPPQFLRGVVKTGESCFPCQGFGAEEQSWNPLPGLHSHHPLGFFPSLGLSLCQFHTLVLFILSVSHPACLCFASLQLSSRCHPCWKIPKPGRTRGCVFAQPRFLDGKKL